MKKAQISFKSVYWAAWVFVFLGVALFTMWTLVNLYESYTINTSILESEEFFNNLIYSSNSISYFDPETGRPVPGVVDLANFNENRVDAAYSFGEKSSMMAALVQLHELKPPIAAAPFVFYNKELYDRLSPLVNIPGAGGADEFDKSMYVLYFNGTGFVPGVLKVSMLIPRS